MHRWLAAKTATACLICCLCFGQQDNADFRAYASFFAQAAQLRNGKPVLLNGQDRGLVAPSVQQTIGLTDGEAAILLTLSVACTAQIRSFDETSRAAILEARLELSATDPAASDRARRILETIGAHRTRIIQSCVNDLRVKLGPPRFEALQAYIESRKNLDFFPPVLK